MKKVVNVKDEIKAETSFITTTELAKLCGVSRFTVINWVNQGKIDAIKTIGKHRRISLFQVISLLETLHIDKEKRGLPHDLSTHCWQFRERTNSPQKCVNCLIYRKGIGYCFLLVRQFGKEAIRCEGNCLKCGYFNDFFSKRKGLEKQDDKKIDMSEESEDKKYFLNNFSYNLGLRMQGLKGRIMDIMDKLVG